MLPMLVLIVAVTKLDSRSVKEILANRVPNYLWKLFHFFSIRGLLKIWRAPIGSRIQQSSRNWSTSRPTESRLCSKTGTTASSRGSLESVLAVARTYSSPASRALVPDLATVPWPFCAAASVAAPTRSTRSRLTKFQLPIHRQLSLRHSRDRRRRRQRPRRRVSVLEARREFPESFPTRTLLRQSLLRARSCSRAERRHQRRWPSSRSRCSLNFISKSPTTSRPPRWRAWWCRKSILVCTAAALLPEHQKFW